MNEVTIFNNTEYGKIRTLVTDEGKVLFCGKDVAEALGYKRTADAIREHCKGVFEIPTPSNGGIQPMKYITESDVYRLAFGSKLPSAEKFTDWVTEEVLPTIRKTGSYGRQIGYSDKEIKQIILQEAAAMLVNIEKRLGLKKCEETPKRFRTKLGQMSEKDRKKINEIINESSSYEQAAFMIRIYFDMNISAHAVRNYVKEAKLR